MKIYHRESPNQNQSDMIKSIVVLHITYGSYKGAISHLTNATSNVSANIIISREGEITELVPIKNAAWHAGNIHEPSARAKRILKKNWYGKYINPNLYTIGIEFAAGYDVDKDGKLEEEEIQLSDKQINACVGYLKKLANNNEVNIDINPANIITHRDIASYKPDIEISRNKILKRLMTLNELKRDSKGGFWFVKKGDNGKQKVRTIGGILTILSREFGVETVSDEYLERLKNKKYFK